MKVIDYFSDSTYVLFSISIKSLVQKIFPNSIYKEGDKFSFEFYDDDLDRKLYLLTKNRIQSFDENNIHTYIDIDTTYNEMFLLVFLDSYLAMMFDINTSDENWQQLLIEIFNLYCKAI